MWVAIDVDSKLVPSWLVGERTNKDVYLFLSDLKSRLRHQSVQISTDGFNVYGNVIEPLFGADCVDFAQIHKTYGTTSDPTRPERTYSPAECTWIEVKVVTGHPRPRAHLHVLHRAPEPHHPNGDAPVHPPHQRVLEEGREPRPTPSVFTFFTTTSLGPPHPLQGFGRPSTPAMAAGVAVHVWSMHEIAQLLDLGPTVDDYHDYGGE